MKRIIVTGRGVSGSWAIRGEQLGHAIGAAVAPNADTKTLRGHDLAILVKRPSTQILQSLRGAGVPVVWDVVDAWPQPDGNRWGRAECMAWAASQIARIRPAAIVAATVAMAEDFACFGVPILALPHHGRPMAVHSGVRDRVETVAYEGGEQYLGRWQETIERQCAARGWRFAVNPPSLAGADIVVAMRDAGGHAARRWKSNVKLANAQAFGVPCVLNRESGYLETASGAERWADTEEELATAFDVLAPRADRVRRAWRLRESAPRLDAVASLYRKWLEQL